MHTHRASHTPPVSHARPVYLTHTLCITHVPCITHTSRVTHVHCIRCTHTLTGSLLTDSAASLQLTEQRSRCHCSSSRRRLREPVVQSLGNSAGLGSLCATASAAGPQHLPNLADLSPPSSCELFFFFPSRTLDPVSSHRRTLPCPGSRPRPPRCSLDLRHRGGRAPFPAFLAPPAGLVLEPRLPTLFRRALSASGESPKLRLKRTETRGRPQVLPGSPRPLAHGRPVMAHCRPPSRPRGLPASWLLLCAPPAGDTRAWRPAHGCPGAPAGQPEAAF